MRKFRKTAEVWAIKMPCAFRLATPEGDIDGATGDFLVMDEARTHAWPVKHDIFLKTYREVSFIE